MDEYPRFEDPSKNFECGMQVRSMNSINQSTKLGRIAKFIDHSLECLIILTIEKKQNMAPINTRDQPHSDKVMISAPSRAKKIPETSR